jgi:hypothetical protein
MTFLGTVKRRGGDLRNEARGVLSGLQEQREAEPVGAPPVHA